MYPSKNLKKNNLLNNSIILEKYYKGIIVEELLLKGSYNNIMEIPKIEKIVINSSSKVIVKDKKYLVPSLLALEILTGRKLMITTAKKSIATFKLRENQLIGCKVTLRKEQMFVFFKKVIKIILPRLRYFKGFTKNSFDKKNNYNLGLRNLMLFPELENFFEFFENLSGINITICSNSKNKLEASLLFSSFQIPIN